MCGDDMILGMRQEVVGCITGWLTYCLTSQPDAAMYSVDQ